MDLSTTTATNIIMIVSAVPVLVTLVLLYWQALQTKKAACSQAYQGIVDSTNEFARFTMSTPDLTEFFYDYDISGKKISSKQAVWAVAMALDLWENLFYQHKQKALIEPLWNHWDWVITNAVKTQGFCSYWQDLKERYPEEFKEFIDERIE